MGLSDAPLLIKCMFGLEIFMIMVQVLLVHAMINHTHGDD